MYCKKCGMHISDQSRFCRFCGASVTPPIPAEMSYSSNLPSGAGGTVPEVPDLTVEEAAVPSQEYTTPPTAPEEPVWNEDYTEEIGSYEDIMLEFTTDSYAPQPQQDIPPAEPPQERSSKRGILIAVSVVLILALLIGTTVLCIKVLIPDPQEEPILEEAIVEQTPEIPVVSTLPSPAVSNVIEKEPEDSVVMPQIAPPESSPEASPENSPENSPETSPETSAAASPVVSVLPSATATPVPSHDASSGNTTVSGTRYVDNVSVGAYFRSAPSQEESNILATVNLGTRVDFIELYNSTYSKVKYNGTYGYIATQYLSEKKPNLTVSGTVYVTNVDYCAYLRSTPEKSDYNTVTYVYLDEALEYIETSGSYIKVKKGIYYGYVHGDYISFSPPNTTPLYTMYVTGVTYGAYFLNYPRQGSLVLATVPPNTAVSYIEDSANNYCKVSYDGKIGYILKDYLTKTSPDQQANEKATAALLVYSLDHSYSYYSFLDLNGDGVDEMLVTNDCLQQDSRWVSSSATLLAYENGKVVEKGVLNASGGDSPMFHIENEDGSYQLVTEFSEKARYVCTFYTLDKSGKLSYEAWSIEYENGVEKYYVDRNGSRQETTVAEHNQAVTSPDYYYVLYEGHIG